MEAKGQFSDALKQRVAPNRCFGGAELLERIQGTSALDTEALP